MVFSISEHHLHYYLQNNIFFKLTQYFNLKFFKENLYYYYKQWQKKTNGKPNHLPYIKIIHYYKIKLLNQYSSIMDFHKTYLYSSDLSYPSSFFFHCASPHSLFFRNLNVISFFVLLMIPCHRAFALITASTGIFFSPLYTSLAMISSLYHFHRGLL